MYEESMYSCRHYNFTSSSAVGYDIRVDAAPGPHGIMHQYRASIGSNNMCIIQMDKSLKTH